MKVIFIYPELTQYSEWKGSYHFGVASLAAVVKKSGHNVSFLHITSEISEKQFLDFLKKESPFHLMAFSSTTNEIHYVKQLADAAKQKYTVPTICGGVHVTTSPDDVISHPSIDMVCLGEGELPLNELCNKIDGGKDYFHIPNIWIKHGNEIVRNPIAPLKDDLDIYPFGDREIFRYDQIEDYGERRLVMMASRGCPFDCTYCCNHLLKERLPTLKKFVRFRSVDNVISEIKVCMEKYPWIERIMFHDDVFTLKKKWLDEFVGVYKKEVHLPFVCNSRANIINEELAMQLKEAGCVQVNMGIESGNEQIRNAVLKRNMSDAQIINAFKICRKVGIRTYAYNIVGLPYETFQGVLDTVKLNARVKPSQIQTSIFYPYPNTELYNICIKEGFINKGKEVTNYFEESILSMNTISNSQIVFACSYFTIMVMLYHLLLKIPGRPGNLFIKFFDRFLSSKYLPYSFLKKIRPYLSFKTALRNIVPTMYDFIRPIYKKYQYRLF